MLTLYQLKQNNCFRCFYKARYFVKNIFLLCVLSVMLFIVYVVYFRADGGSYKNAVKILKGLNSNTFNHLQAHSSKNLRVDQKVWKFGIGQQVTPLRFFSECVKFNKPCYF